MKSGSSTVQIKQIAQAVGMSQSTVSIVLNGRGDEMRIAKQTQKRILEVAKEMNYRPNIYARRLRGTDDKQPNQIVAVFWNDTYMGDTMSRFFKGAVNSIENNNYGIEFMVQLFKSGHLENYKEYLSIQKYNGVIIAGTSSEDRDFLEKGDFSVPIVLSSRSSEKLSSVYTDGYMIGRECARMFAKKGVRTAGLLGIVQTTSSASLRELGFLNGCTEEGILVKPGWIIKKDSRDMEEGYRGAKELLAMSEKPEALFILYDSLALGALFAFKEAKVQIPQELSLVVYGINEMLRNTSPTITMIGNSMESAGENSLDLLMTIINNTITFPINRVILPSYEFGDSFKPQEEG